MALNLLKSLPLTLLTHSKPECLDHAEGIFHEVFDIFIAQLPNQGSS